MIKEYVRSVVYRFFSDTLMVFLALLIIPVVLAEYLLELTAAQNIVLSAVNWSIYALFVLEFILKLTVADKKVEFLKANKFYTIISIVIIVSPLLEPISYLFAATPALRALRIFTAARLSRLTAVIAASERARLGWKRINYRTYAIVTSVIVFGFLISFFKPDFNMSEVDQGLLSQFIQVTATVYAIITGFVIANVWGKYSLLIRAINLEATSLRNVCLLSLQLNDRQATNSLSRGIAAYARAVVDVYWRAIGQKKVLYDSTVNIYSTLIGYRPKNSGEVEIYTNIIDELRRASEGQATIKSLLAATTPRILWALISLLSAILISGFFFLNFDSQILATATLTLVSTAVALVVTIIYDMNNPFKFGFWAVTPEAYIELEEAITEKEHSEITR